MNVLYQSTCFLHFVVMWKDFFVCLFACLFFCERYKIGNMINVCWLYNTKGFQHLFKISNNLSYIQIYYQISRHLHSDSLLMPKIVSWKKSWKVYYVSTLCLPNSSNTNYIRCLFFFFSSNTEICSFGFFARNEILLRRVNVKKWKMILKRCWVIHAWRSEDVH